MAPTQFPFVEHLQTMTSAPTTAHRYAVCFAPNPGSLGWLAGSHWLGRCAALLQPLQQLSIDGVAADDLHRLTAAPRRLGWHAPLKAPFALAPGTDWLTLYQTMQALAYSLAPCALPPLHVARRRDCLALVPAASPASQSALQHIATACATQLQPLAAAPSDADMAQARTGGLTTRQDMLLQQWGDRFVLDEFRFHLPITGNLALVDAATQALVLDAAQEYFSDLPAMTFNSLALFAEPTPGADFVLLDHLEMAG